MNPTSDFVEVIAQKIAYYTVVAERCQSDLRFRVLDDRTLRKHYKSACKQWRQHPGVYPVYMPAVGDAASKTAFFRKCDAVCASRPDTPPECARLALVSGVVGCGPLTLRPHPPLQQLLPGDLRGLRRDRGPHLARIQRAR